MSDFVITCNSTESELALAGRVYCTWEDADWALQCIAARAPAGDAYHKTSFTVRHLPSGRKRTIRVDVHNPDHSTAPRLRGAIVVECNWLLGPDGEPYRTLERAAEAAFWKELLT